MNSLRFPLIFLPNPEICSSLFASKVGVILKITISKKNVCVCVRGIHQKKDINILWGLFFVLVSFYQQKWIDRSCAPKNTYPKLFHEAHSDFKRNHSKFPKLQELDYHIKKTYPPPPKFNSSPLKIGRNPKERIIFQPSIFRGYAGLC